jgi:hypothetical protein
MFVDYGVSIIKTLKTIRWGILGMNLYNAIEKRISIRKYEDEIFDEKTVKEIKEKILKLKPMYEDIKIRLELIEAKPIGIGTLYGFAKINAPYCIVAITEMKNGHMENIGFMQEQLVLELTDMGIGTCWLGTYNDKKIREILKLNDNEKITNVISLGYSFKQKNFYNDVFRNLIGRNRKKETEVAYYRQWGNDIGEYLNKNQYIKKVLHLSILAPSGNNKQPVYIVFNENNASFFVKNKKGDKIINSSAELDAGIFISHFYLCLNNDDIEVSFYEENSPIKNYNIPSEFSYIISLKYHCN